MLFGKKCERCGKKISKEFAYCPHCGNVLKKHEGLIEELENDSDFGFGMPFKIFGFGNLLKEIDKQFRDIDKMMGERKMSMPEAEGISISVNMTGARPEIKVRRFGKEGREEKIPIRQQVQQQIQKPVRISKEQEEKFARLATLPRTEPETSVRRLADRIVYEIALPGVHEKDVMIKKLENSIEIKAFTKDKAFFKLIPLSLPIKKYYMKQGKLFLELVPEI